MTIVQAFKKFVKALTGVEPTGNTIADVMSDGADKVEGKTLVLNSSTPGSDKKFAVTVDDSGELEATEVVED